MADSVTLSSDELAFLKSQGLTSSNVFDCRGRSIASCKGQAKAEGKDILIGTKCARAGHRLRSRGGQCVQCDTRNLAYQGRKSLSGNVYLAHSASRQLVKIGFSTSIHLRENKLNYDSVGGASDWKLIFYVTAPRAGELEIQIHKTLQQFNKHLPYVKDGLEQISKECFTCLPKDAVKAILLCAKKIISISNEPMIQRAS